MPPPDSLEIEPGFFLHVDRITGIYDLVNRSPFSCCLVQYRSKGGDIIHRIAARPMIQLIAEYVAAKREVVRRDEASSEPSVDAGGG